MRQFSANFLSGVVGVCLVLGLLVLATEQAYPEMSHVFSEDVSYPGDDVTLAPRQRKRDYCSASARAEASEPCLIAFD